MSGDVRETLPNRPAVFDLVNAAKTLLGPFVDAPEFNFVREMRDLEQQGHVLRPLTNLLEGWASYQRLMRQEDRLLSNYGGKLPQGDKQVVALRREQADALGSLKQSAKAFVDVVDPGGEILDAAKGRASERPSVEQLVNAAKLLLQPEIYLPVYNFVKTMKDLSLPGNVIPVLSDLLSGWKDYKGWEVTEAELWQEANLSMAGPQFEGRLEVIQDQKGVELAGMKAAARKLVTLVDAPFEPRESVPLPRFTAA
jgi:hypothetical protein